MKIVNCKLIIFLLTLTSCFMIVVSVMAVHAQEEDVRSITISPPTIEKSLNPGETAEGEMRVINDGTQPLTFKVSVQDFMVDNTVGTPVILPPNTLSNKYSGAAWVGVTPNTFTVAPHQKAILQYFIQVPYGAKPGGHYAAVLYTPTTNSVKGTGASVETKIGTLVLITVPGPVQEKANVTRFFAPFSEYGPVTVFTQIKNMSDIHIKPLGNITVKNLFGQKETYQLKENNIFPTAARDYTNKVGKGFMIGPYTATLLASYGTNKNLPLTATATFFVFPWRLSLVVLLIIVAIVLGYKYMKKRNSNTQKNTENTPPPTQTTV